MNGGGVALFSGTFTMRNGIIFGNKTQDGGGGVSVAGGAFTMRGGEISGNTAQGGGGVVIDAPTGGKFIKTGGTIDAANSAGIGSAVFVFLGGNIYQKRDAAAGPDVNLGSGKSGGAGGWE
jgi:hypothetical protein